MSYPTNYPPATAPSIGSLSDTQQEGRDCLDSQRLGYPKLTVLGKFGEAAAHHLDPAFQPSSSTSIAPDPRKQQQQGKGKKKKNHLVNLKRSFLWPHNRIGGLSVAASRTDLAAVGCFCGDATYPLARTLEAIACHSSSSAQKTEEKARLSSHDSVAKAILSSSQPRKRQ